MSKALDYLSSGPSSTPAGGEIFSTINWVPLPTAFHYLPLIVLIRLKYCYQGRKIASHPSNPYYLCIMHATYLHIISTSCGNIFTLRSKMGSCTDRSEYDPDFEHLNSVWVKMASRWAYGLQEFILNLAF